MILPDGYSDVPAGKIAAVVTHLEMTERPALPPDPPGAWTLRTRRTPALDWYREIFPRRRHWFGVPRIRMIDAELAATIHSPLDRAVYALAQEGRDEGLLEIDFR